MSLPLGAHQLSECRCPSFPSPLLGAGGARGVQPQCPAEVGDCAASWQGWLPGAQPARTALLTGTIVQGS